MGRGKILTVKKDQIKLKQNKRNIAEHVSLWNGWSFLRYMHMNDIAGP